MLPDLLHLDVWCLQQFVVDSDQSDHHGAGLDDVPEEIQFSWQIPLRMAGTSSREPETIFLHSN